MKNKKRTFLVCGTDIVRQSKNRFYTFAAVEYHLDTAFRADFCESYSQAVLAAEHKKLKNQSPKITFKIVKVVKL